MAQMWVDPPEGWKYGFPRQIPNDVVDHRKWLVEQGYPQKVMDEYGDYFFCRYWYDVVDGSTIEEKDKK